MEWYTREKKESDMGIGLTNNGKVDVKVAVDQQTGRPVESTFSYILSIW
jgi:hypothetical protein